MRVGTYPTRDFATLGPLSLRPPFTGASVQSFVPKDEPFPLTFRHWAGVSPYTSPFGLAETCVFDKQSPEPLHCAPQKLRQQVASLRGYPFSQSYRAKLSNSLTRVLSYTLGRLPLPTSVGLRYGRQKFLQRGFSRRPRLNEIPQGQSPEVLTPLSSQNGFTYPGHRLQRQTHHVQ